MFALKTSSMTPFAVIFTASHKLIPCQTASAIGYWLSFFICVANFLSQKKQQKRIESTEACDCFFFKFVFKFYFLSQFQSVDEIYITKHLSQENTNKSNHFTFDLRMWPNVATF